MKLLRFSIALALATLGAWIGRLLAHSKVPPPEGHWREVSPEELRSKR